MKTEAFYCKSDTHVRPIRLSIACTQTDSSDKTQMICSPILLCLFTSIYDINRSRLNYSTACSNKSKHCILICKSSARTKQSAISVALKTTLEIRLEIRIYKTLFLHRSDDCIGFIPSCPPHILQQNCAHEVEAMGTSQ